MPNSASSQRSLLKDIARRAIVERGLEPDFPAAALLELSRINGPAVAGRLPARDLRNLRWCSIDNDDSRDLDQLSVASLLADQSVQILVAVADVDALVPLGSAIDRHAQHNTTSVYTAGATFPMLPEKLSTDLTSLGPNVERRALVTEMTFAPNGALRNSDVYAALVKNRAKLAYDSVAGWLENRGPIPTAIQAVPGLDEVIRLQDRTAEKLKSLRHRMGALDLATIEARPVFAGETLEDIVVDRRNRAKDLIEDFMIAVNGVVARFLGSRGRTSLRRVVRTPKHWEGIVELAATHGVRLPEEADSQALEDFLVRSRAADPDGFPDLSLSVIKLLGSGEYVVEIAGEPVPGHFGLAVRDYTHSTAPNRRYPDLITQRLVKAALAGDAPPYSNEELKALAFHCTEQENAAKKAERQVQKCAAILLLQSRIGEEFDGLVTGASEKGTWVRILRPAAEGRVVQGGAGLAVGQKVRVKLLHIELQRAFVDFAALNPNSSGRTVR